MSFPGEIPVRQRQRSDAADTGRGMLVRLGSHLGLTT